MHSYLRIIAAPIFQSVIPHHCHGNEINYSYFTITLYLQFFYSFYCVLGALFPGTGNFIGSYETLVLRTALASSPLLHLSSEPVFP